MTNLYYNSIQGAFDRVAGSYDAWLDGSDLNARMRATSLEVLERVFQPGDSLLELGCGTGRETVHMAKGGMHVVATDISPEMVRITRSKISEMGLDANAEVHTVPSGEISSIATNEAVPFDGAYASFGPLNCEPDLAAVARDLSGLLKPGSTFITSMMNRLCLSEMVLYSLALKPTKAFRRLKTPVPIRLDKEVGMKAYVHTLREAVEAFRPCFELVQVQGLLVALPPPYLENIWSRLGGMQRMVEKIDSALCNRTPFVALGDHYLLELRKMS